MDADTLRRYLAQQREAGEESIVFETMSRSEALTNPMPVVSAGVKKPRAGAEAPAADWRAVLGGPPSGAKQERATPRPPPAVREAVPSTGATDSASTLDALAATIAGCRLCSLGALAKNPVPGEGNPNADFMIVGEAPGQTEDETGRPFVGAAGQLLTKILAAINLTREDVFICNVLKHRPPGNRNPLPEEVRVCSPYLIRQIALIQPKVILALGTFASQTLLETTTPIGKLRGRVHQYQNVPLVVTYHPAALLRNPGWRKPTWEDVQMARRIFDGLDG